MTRPNRDVIAAIIEWLEIGKTDNVVVVAMGEEKIDVGNPLRPKRHTCGMKSRPRIEQKDMVAASNLDADGIPTVFSEVFT